MFLLEGCDGTVHFAWMEARASLGGPGVGGDDTDEVAVADEFDAGHLLRGGGVDGVERSVVAGGAENFAEHHAGKRDVGGILMLSGHEVAAIGLGNWQCPRSSSPWAA